MATPGFGLFPAGSPQLMSGSSLSDRPQISGIDVGLEVLSEGSLPEDLQQIALFHSAFGDRQSCLLVKMLVLLGHPASQVVEMLLLPGRDIRLVLLVDVGVEYSPDDEGPDLGEIQFWGRVDKVHFDQVVDLPEDFQEVRVFIGLRDVDFLLELSVKIDLEQFSNRVFGDLAIVALTFSLDLDRRSWLVLADNLTGLSTILLPFLHLLSLASSLLCLRCLVSEPLAITTFLLGVQSERGINGIFLIILISYQVRQLIKLMTLQQFIRFPFPLNGSQ